MPRLLMLITVPAGVSVSSTKISVVTAPVVAAFVEAVVITASSTAAVVATPLMLVEVVRTATFGN